MSKVGVRMYSNFLFHLIDRQNAIKVPGFNFFSIKFERYLFFSSFSLPVCMRLPLKCSVMFVILLKGNVIKIIIWDTKGLNMSLGFLTKQDFIHSPQFED